jgi:hypothetical protein
LFVSLPIRSSFVQDTAGLVAGRRPRERFLISRQVGDRGNGFRGQPGSPRIGIVEKCQARFHRLAPAAESQREERGRALSGVPDGRP